MPSFHPRRDPPAPGLVQQTRREPPAPDRIEVLDRHAMRGLLIACLLATPFWAAFFVALYFLLR
jgi:hypothetical protein